MTGPQCDAVAAEIANLKRGDNQHGGSLKLDTLKPASEKVSIETAAKKMGRSRASVVKAITMQICMLLSPKKEAAS